MANTIAEAVGYDSSRTKETHRLGSVASQGRAATWETEAVAYIRADGSGYVLVRWLRTGEVIHEYSFDSEAERREV